VLSLTRSIQGIMKLDDERLDDVVPQLVLRQFVRAFFAGFEGVLSQMALSE
jgi:hypothetical protein